MKLLGFSGVVSAYRCSKSLRQGRELQVDESTRSEAHEPIAPVVFPASLSSADGFPADGFKRHSEENFARQAEVLRSTTKSTANFLLLLGFSGQQSNAMSSLCW